MNRELSKNILLVEDEPIIAMAEKHVLEKFGYSVFLASTGEEAVKSVNTAAPIDLVLMDIDLGPGIDGTTAADTILRSKDLPVVFLSSHTEPNIVEKTESITSYGYIVKNAGETVIHASIKMAFRLFEAKMLEKKRSDELRLERDRAQMYLDVAGVMFVAIDRNETVSLINRKGCEILGLSKNDIIGKNWFDSFIPGESANEVKTVFRKMMNGELDPVEFYDNEVITSTGGRRLLSWHNTVLRDRDGAITGTLSSGVDITDQRKIEEELIRQVKEKEVLVGEIHHRIRNTIADIADMLELQAQDASNAETETALRQAIGRVNTMRDIDGGMLKDHD